MSAIGMRARRSITPEFKAQAVKLVRETGKSVGRVAIESDLLPA